MVITIHDLQDEEFSALLRVIDLTEDSTAEKALEAFARSENSQRRYATFQDAAAYLEKYHSEKEAVV